MFLMQMQLSVFRLGLGSRDLAGSNHIFTLFRIFHHTIHHI